MNFVTILIDTSSPSLTWDVGTGNGQGVVGVIAEKLKQLQHEPRVSIIEKKKRKQIEHKDNNI